MGYNNHHDIFLFLYQFLFHQKMLVFEISYDNFTLQSYIQTSFKKKIIYEEYLMPGLFLPWIIHNADKTKDRSWRLRPKAHIFDNPLDNPYDVLKVPYGPINLELNQPGLILPLKKLPMILKTMWLIFLEVNSTIKDLCRGPWT